MRLRVLDEWGAQFRSNGRDTYDYVYSFIVSGCIGMLQCWLEERVPIPTGDGSHGGGVLVKGVTALSVTARHAGKAPLPPGAGNSTAHI